MDREKAKELFEKYCEKLRISPQWDVKLEFVEDPDWRKTGDVRRRNLSMNYMMG